MGAYESNATTFTVTNNNDSGAGSLRSTVAAAVAAGQSNTVDFAPNVTGTILLTSGSIQVPGAVRIAGPGAATLAIDGNANNRIFTIFENSALACPAQTGPSLYLVTVSGLTLTNAFRKTDNSGGAIVTGHSLVLKDVIVQNSQAKVGGGVGFFAQFPGQSLTVTNSQFLNNIAKPLSVITTGNTGGGLRIGENCTGAERRRSKSPSRTACSAATARNPSRSTVRVAGSTPAVPMPISPSPTAVSSTTASSYLTHPSRIRIIAAPVSSPRRSP